MQIPVGLYSNLVTMRNMPVPPTILLMDGLNSDRAGQMQVHRQMVKLLGSIPLDIPLAVFLLDRNLHLLQNFSTDRSLLRTAVDRALSIGVQELNPTDVRADPDALSTVVQDNPPPPPPIAGPGGTTVGPELQQTRNAAVSEQVLQLQRFEKEASTTLITIRVQITLDAPDAKIFCGSLLRSLLPFFPMPTSSSREWESLKTNSRLWLTRCPMQKLRYTPWIQLDSRRKPFMTLRHDPRQGMPQSELRPVPP